MNRALKIFALPTLSLALTLALTSSPAQSADVNAATALTAGPVNVANGFPTWYRDTTSLALVPCLSQAASPTGGAGTIMCVLPVAGDEVQFNPALPVTFPTPLNFPSEPFYFIAEGFLGGAKGTAPLTDGSSFDYRAATEAAFLNGVQQGQQITFTRTRIRMDVVTPGDYRITHPYGVREFGNVTAGIKAINFTEDLGIGATGGPFANLVPPNVNVGPFLAWDAGQPIIVGNERFIGDPNIPHAVTGSPAGTNFIRVEVDTVTDGTFNPATSVILGETNLFTVAGKKIGIDVTPFPAAAPVTALVGTPATIPFTVTNLTSTPVGLTNAGLFSFAGTNATDFSVVPGTDTCTGTTLQAPPATPSSCTFQVAFNPAASTTAARNATIAITADDAVNAPPVSVALSGTAQYALTIETATSVTSGGTRVAGTVIPAPGTVNVNAGASQQFTFTPEAGYFPRVLVDGAFQSVSNNTLTLSSLGANHLVNVKFVRNGDVVEDGTINLTDVLKALRIAVGMVQPTPEERVAADVAPLVANAVKPDGKVNVSDVLVLLRRSVNLDPVW
ncbi:hypothetical protein [Geomobilimonas luticola]|uniref:Choice-of-anchor D domain-containing protein n=1 Tax=Geomobilimonas luticola TaxID=1114878 RepID=A0ABS5SBN5_9BACT|nr:hypothetical protein [Geomobilimonas luticola]MBT0652770.1 hypothetical protein [Geomobilimonas luticola]